MLTLILGGNRSGKSRYAQQCALESGKPVIYIATATAGDDEMQARIDRHRVDRPEHWLTIEEPVKLASILSKQRSEPTCFLIECLTLWLNNVLFKPQKKLFQQERDLLLNVLPTLIDDVLLVSNEIGMGVVAADKMTRHFVDEAGRLHQQLAQVCDRVVLVTAGLPQILK